MTTFNVLITFAFDSCSRSFKKAPQVLPCETLGNGPPVRACVAVFCTVEFTYKCLHLIAGHRISGHDRSPAGHAEDFIQMIFIRPFLFFIQREAGSTCFEIIPYLAQKKGLTIIVNSLHLMSRLHEQLQHKIIILGGQYRQERMDMIGPTAELAISQLSGFTAFTGADDIAIEAGISGADVATVSFTKMVLRRASHVIFVGDRSKFDNPALYKIADIDGLDAIVTNVYPGDEWAKVCGEKEIQLIWDGGRIP